MGQNNKKENGVYFDSSSGWFRVNMIQPSVTLDDKLYNIQNGTYAAQQIINTNEAQINIGTTDITYDVFRSFIEQDPVFMAHVASTIDANKITNWNAAFSHYSNFDFT